MTQRHICSRAVTPHTGLMLDDRFEDIAFYSACPIPAEFFAQRVDDIYVTTVATLMDGLWCEVANFHGDGEPMTFIVLDCGHVRPGSVRNGDEDVAQNVATSLFRNLEG